VHIPNHCGTLPDASAIDKAAAVERRKPRSLLVILLRKEAGEDDRPLISRAPLLAVAYLHLYFCRTNLGKVMPLPVNGLWTIRMAVTRRLPEDVLPSRNGNSTTSNIAETSVSSMDSGGFDHDPTDWVSVRMGPNLTSLHHVADIKNVVNDDFGEVKKICPQSMSILTFSLPPEGRER